MPALKGPLTSEIRKELEIFCAQHHESIDESILQDFDYWLLKLPKEFCKRRDPTYLAQIIYRLGFFRYELDWRISLSPEKRHHKT